MHRLKLQHNNKDLVKSLKGNINRKLRIRKQPLGVAGGTHSQDTMYSLSNCLTQL